jgi:hypothetical protein
MEKSFVGDPIQWSGLVYSPLNNAGLLFALGTVAGSLGLLFEEFSDDFKTAVCRRNTPSGWERLKVEFVYRSSEYFPDDEIDLLICWIDDNAGYIGPTRLVLSEYAVSGGNGKMLKELPTLESILPEGAADDLMGRGQSRESYEETIKLLDEQIKKLKKD